jgi:hypothetical protein
MIKILYKLYEFIFFLFRNYYYKDDVEECKRHSSIIFTTFLFFPFMGVMIFLSSNFIPNSMWSKQSDLVRKIVLLPIAFVLFYIGFKLVKIYKFNSIVLKKEKEGLDYKTFSFIYKFKFILSLVLLFISVLLIPLLISKLL